MRYLAPIPGARRQAPAGPIHLVVSARMGFMAVRAGGRAVQWVATVVCGLLATPLLVGSISFFRSEARWHELATHGISAEATVLSASYDPSGGDPDGWTIERVVFSAGGPAPVYATLGHHGSNGAENKSIVPVVFDP